MRGVIAAFIISAAIVGGSFIYTDKMNKISGELTEINNSVAEKINAEDYDAAMSDIERLRGAVDERRVFLTATGNHTRLDEVEKSVSELMSYAEDREKSDAYARCRSLGVLIENLPRDYRICLENIL